MKEPFYLKFTYFNEKSFQSAEKVFKELCRCKETKDWSEDLEYWRPIFGEEAMSKFWWPTPDEIKRWQELYLATPVDQRQTHPDLQHPWDFLSMIDCFKDGDYEFVSFEKSGEGTGKLYYEPNGWPFGGTDAMKAYLESFSFTVTEVFP